MAKAKTAPKQVTAAEAVPVLLGVLVIVVPMIFYFMVYADLETQENNARNNIITLQKEIHQLQKQSEQYEMLKEERANLKRNIDKLQSKLPATTDELNYFLESVNQRARASRVSKWVLFKQEGLISHGDYSSLPIRMEFEATYEAAIQFFWDLATMGDGMQDNSKEQIVNIREVHMERMSNSQDAGVPMLKVNCIAETYLYTGAKAGGQG